MSSMNHPEEHAANGRSRAGQTPPSRRPPEPTWMRILAPLASLKLTVVLFALAIFIVLAGTFAQVNADVWEVVDHYFRAKPEQLRLDSFPWFNPAGLFVWIDFQIFLPPSFFPSRPELPDWLGVWFPKGWTIGAVMMLNLFAAHLIRFRTQARGTRMTAGLAVTAIGALVTALVILSGANTDGFQQEPLISYEALWALMQVGVLGLAATSVYGALSLPAERKYERWGLWATALTLCGFLVWTFIGQGGSRFDDSSMRILYQLLKGTVAGVILLIGCILLFRKRAGLVLLHAGIGLMMVSEVLVGLHAEEAQMRIEEGTSSNFVEDIHSIELAFVRDLGDDTEQHTVIPEHFLHEGATISNDELPVDVEVVQFIPNADLVPLSRAPEGTEQLATAGVGTSQVAIPVRTATGTDTDGAVDMAALYVTLRDKQTGQPIDTYLVSTLLDLFNLGRNTQTVTVDGTEYNIQLRFKRTYKPYTITLNDIRKEDYIGTNTPRDYSSYVRLQDESRGVDREIRIWMNNPLRYAGETFYQSSYVPANTYYPGSKEWTSLQVVRNSGWMIPYVSCMIVAVGMFAQFGLTLLRFIRRRETAPLTTTAGSLSRRAPDDGTAPTTRFDPRTIVLSLLLVGSFGIYLAREAATPKLPADGMNVEAFGALPVVYQGRSKPLDTLARNTLLIISDRQTFREEVDGKSVEQPAIRWFLDVITESEAALHHRVFRIENIELLETLGLERRPGFRYAIAEFQDRISDFEEEVRAARQLDKEDLTFYQRKVLDLATKLQTYLRMREAFVPPSLPELPSQQEMETDRNAAILKLQQVARIAMRESQRLEQAGIPLTIPVDTDHEEQAGPNGTWTPFSVAILRAYLQTQLLGEAAPEKVVEFNNILRAYSAGDASDFNSAVTRYRRTLAKSDHAGLNLKKIRFEQFFNRLAPFYHCAAWYLIVFVLSCIAWLVWPKPINRAAMWLTLAIFLVHTFAVGARIYISGRPPVTNLYSSAVFIGWACVLGGIIVEAVYRLGVGNIIAAVAGFLTLGIAHFLAGDGDTFTVLQAVLDTQFWLATHVVCITLGYAATYLAGLMGLIYILRGSRFGPLAMAATFGGLSYWLLASTDWDLAVMAGRICAGLALASAGAAAAQFTGKLKIAVNESSQDSLIRMTYGTLCFALFFSFVGTVLGGLWADDSWGRFWGWDPKENGALIIVLWTALVLHARWDRLVRDRGLAVLAVLGNIAVSWSWFGVNELGVGLHTYGFTEGVLMAFGVFCISQLAIALVACLPNSLWWDTSRAQNSTTA